MSVKLQELWNSKQPISLPIDNDTRTQILQTLTNKTPYTFNGTIADIVKLQEMWCLRIGHDDEWLVYTYNKNFPFADRQRQ